LLVFFLPPPSPFLCCFVGRAFPSTSTSSGPPVRPGFLLQAGRNHMVFDNSPPPSWTFPKFQLRGEFFFSGEPFDPFSPSPDHAAPLLSGTFSFPLSQIGTTSPRQAPRAETWSVLFPGRRTIRPFRHFRPSRRFFVIDRPFPFCPRDELECDPSSSSANYSAPRLLARVLFCEELPDKLLPPPLLAHFQGVSDPPSALHEAVAGVFPSQVLPPSNRSFKRLSRSTKARLDLINPDPLLRADKQVL